MSYKPGDSATIEFVTSDATGAATNADSLPAGTINRNGTDDIPVTVAITNLDAGRYKAVFTIPVGYAAGDSVNLSIAATIGGIAAKATSGPWVLDSKRLADITNGGGVNATQLAGHAITAASGVTFPAVVSNYAGADTSGTTTLLSRVGSPAGASVSADLAAVQTSVNNLNNLSALANLFGPSQLEIPVSGSIAYPLTLTVKDSEGHLVDLSASPTVTAANAAGTDRSGNLSAVSHPGTGQYAFTYAVQSTAVQEGISIKASGTASSDSTTRLAYASVAVVSIDTTTTLTAIKAKTDLIATNAADSPNAATAQAGTTTLLTRLPAALTFIGGNVAANTQATAATLSFNLTGNITGNLSGSIGSAPDSPTAVKMLTMLQGSGPYAFTTAALANGAGGGATPSQVAAAVWQDLKASSDFTVSGSIGSQLAGVSTAAISAALAGSTILVVGPVGNGAVQIVKGSAYRSAYGNALDFPTPVNAGWPSDFTNWTNLSFTATRSPYNANAGDALDVWTMTAPVVSGAGQKLRLELASAQTSTLAPGVGTKGYNFRISGMPPESADTVVLLEGLMTVDA